LLGLLSSAGIASGAEAWVDVDSREAGMRDELLVLRTKLYGYAQQGLVNPDVDAAYWMVDRALAGKASADAAVRYAKETLEGLEPRKPVELKTRTLTKAEHDALLDGPAPKSVSKEDYERMMREAQDG
jgi:hypothetical protein